MRITVMGSGGVGGYFGGRLAAAGHEVSFVARGPHLAALQRDGLRIESPLGDLHLPRVNATGDPATIGAADVVLFGVKLWDTQAAAASIQPLVGEHTRVISLQNGIVKDDLLRQVLPAQAVVGGVCYIAATIGGPGLIRHTGTMQKLVFGSFDAAPQPALEQLAAACTSAGIEHALSGDIQLALWQKFAFLAALSGLTTAARLPVGPLRNHPRSRAFLHDLIDEGVQVARAEGVALPADHAAERMAFLDQLPATMTSSMHHDLERGNRLELPWLSGDVVARGSRSGVQTPCHRAVLDILSPHTEGRPA